MSPDGTTIAVASRKNWNCCGSGNDVWLMRKDTFGYWTLNFRLTYYSNSETASSFTWSRNGVSLYYNLWNNTNTQFLVVDDVAVAVGTGRRLQEGQHEQYSLSPNQTEIAIPGLGPNNTGSVRIVNLDGSNPRSILLPVDPLWRFGWRPMQQVVCPWGGTYSSNGKCNYTFNPSAAAAYAIKYAANACPFFCKYSYPGPGTNTCAEGGNTDCANFVSQALLYGGLPLTKDWYCRLQGNPIACIQDSGYENWSGAIYKPNPPAELKKRQLPAYMYHLSGNILTSDQVPEMQEKHPEPYPYPVSPLPPLELQQRVNTAKAVGRALSNAGFGVGDIMFTGVSGKEHVAIIVAWGPALSNWSELNNLYNEINDERKQLSNIMTSENTVPYVVDHGPHGEFAINKLAQRFTYRGLLSLPKPYYALEWDSTRNLGSFVEIRMTEDRYKWGVVGGAPTLSFSLNELIIESVYPDPNNPDPDYAGFTKIDLLATCPLSQ
jgi:hypothetical protein